MSDSPGSEDLRLPLHLLAARFEAAVELRREFGADRWRLLLAAVLPEAYPAGRAAPPPRS